MMPVQGANRATLKWMSPDPIGLLLDAELASSKATTVSARGSLPSPKRTRGRLSQGWRGVHLGCRRPLAPTSVTVPRECGQGL